jgi:hypothetical protein
MTIAVGFKCYEGILLATDTMYSGGPNNSDGEKMWVLSADVTCPANLGPVEA